MTRIEQFGWRNSVEHGIGRIVSAHGDYYHLVCNEAEGEILARKKKSSFTRMKTIAPDDMKRSKVASAVPPPVLSPITGDFVRFRYNAQGESLILDVLPRFSHFERKDPTARRVSQTLAVNFDTLFVMMSLNENFSLPRIERYLALAEDRGEAECVVVLTKSDLDGSREVGADLKEDQLPCPVIRASSVTGEGFDRLGAFFSPGRTVALIGSSGVGKSTLVNRLAGAEWQATQEIQEWSGKGRHTTTSRELILLPNGALVLDTPGIREIGRLGEVDDELVKGESTHRWRKK